MFRRNSKKAQQEKPVEKPVEKAVPEKKIDTKQDKPPLPPPPEPLKNPPLVYKKPAVHSSRVLLAYNNATEFSFERTVLWNEILPEIQQIAFHVGADLQWIDPLPEEGTLTTQHAEHIISILDRGETDWLICLLGDCYGEVGPPTEIRKAEYDSIRQAVFEQNADVKFLDQQYAIDRTREHEEYRLVSPDLDSKTKAKLVKIIQKGAKAAFEEGLINQILETRQARFFQSPIHFVVNKALSMGTRVIFVLRMFQNAQYDKGKNSKYQEKSEDMKKSIRELKNLVSSRADQKMVFSHSLTLDSCDVENFFTTRESDRYRNTLTRQITERIKSQLLENYLSIPVESQKSLLTLATEENAMHTAHAMDRIKAHPWLARNYDKSISQMLEHKEGSVYLIQGPELCGKTQFLCRLYEKTPEKAYKIIRFSNLTYSSMFAHELWHHIVATLAALSQQPLDGIQKSFLLSTTIIELENLLKKVDKPLYLFLDDANLTKSGHFLSAINQRLQKAPSNLYIYMTALNTSTVNSIFPVQQTVNMDPMTSDNIVEMLKLNMTTMNRKISSEQLSLIKHQLSGTNCNIVLGRTLLDELLEINSGVMGNGIEGRLKRLEAALGDEAVKNLCRYLVCSLNGLTTLELFDVLSTAHPLMDNLGRDVSFDPLLLDNILLNFGSLFKKVTLDNRIVYQISHASLIHIFRHRYLPSTTVIKDAHNHMSEVLSESLDEHEITSPRSKITYHVFPQATKRDNGAFNVRKLRCLWYHLLHTGNMDSLKDWTLCQFEYLDAVCCSCGILHLLTLYEECAMQVLHHDIQVLCEQVLLPALPTIVRDPDQLTAEVIGRLRYTRSENSHFLNTLVEKSMTFVDTFHRKPLLVPLSCWIPPPIMKSCRSFTLKDWKVGHTILAPTHNHQHVLITGNLSAPGVIYMYHIPSQLLVSSFTGHTGTVTSLSTSNNGNFFVSTSEDCSTRIWAFTGENIKTYTLHKKKVMCSIISTNDKLLITGSADSSAKVYDLENERLIRNFTEHTGSVVSLQLTSNDEYLITGSGDFVVHIWSITKGNVVGRLGGLMAPVSCVAITSNDSYITVGCEDETLRVYSTVSTQELHELMGHEGKVNALVAAQDDCQLFAGTKSRIYCYDIHNGQILDILDCQQASPVHSLKLTADNFFLISGCGPRVQVWNVHKRAYDNHDTSQDKEGFVTAIAMSPDEKVAACGTFNGVIAIWDLEICQCVTTAIQSKGIPVSCLAFTLNSLYLLAGNTHGNIVVIEVASGIVFRDMNIHETEVTCIHAIEGGRIFSCCREGRMFMWSLNDDDMESIMENYMDGIFPPIYVQPSGKTVIAFSALNSKEMKIWAYSDAGYQQKNKIYHNEEITCFAATPHGVLVATGSADHSLKLWQMESGYLTQVLVGHDDVVTCIALDEDEKIVVSGAKDQKLIVWSVTTGDFLHTIHRAAALTTVVLTQDASVIFIGMEDSWIEAWSSETGTLLSSFNAHKPVRQLIRSFDGTRILAQLSGCAQLPILCLHNTPAVRAEVKQRRRSARATSVTSIGSANASSSEPKKASDASNPHALTPGGNGVSRLPPPRSTFDKLERTKSRASVIEKDRTTTLTTSTAPPPQKSGLCSLL